MFKWFTRIAVAITMVVCVLVLAIGIYAMVLNAANKIDEGVVIDKNYHASYVTTTYYRTNDNISIPIHTTHPESYSFTIQGDKNGETVKYTFNVPESEYNSYSIGDYYKK